MKTIITLSILLVCVGCNKKTELQTEILKQDDTVTSVSNTIKEPMQAMERIDTISMDEFKGYFKEKERQAYNIFEDTTLQQNFDSAYTFWKNKRLWINDSLKSLNIWGYPKSYKRVSPDIIRVTTVSEGENQIHIGLFTLNKYYNTVDLDFLTGFGGDEGMSDRSFGHFKNDSLYALTKWTTGWETDSIEQVTNTCLIIRKSGIIDVTENCR
jgi:hypothetical protein